MAKTRFAQSGDFRIAYQTIGSGPLDILLVPPVTSHIDLNWADPNFTWFMRKLASLGRFITFDKRGTGRSDRLAGAAPLEDRLDDVTAVLDAAGSQRALLIGLSEGAATAALFAAAYPARVLGLAMVSSITTGSPVKEHPGAFRPERLEQAMDIYRSWGDGKIFELYAPSRAGGRLHHFLLGLYERASATQQSVTSLVETMLAVDVRHVLPHIPVPTLVLHRVGDVAPVEGARVTASLIPGARFVEFEGDDHLPFVGSNREEIFRELANFAERLQATKADRVVSTVMFTDIVGSTERLVSLGDREWLALRDRHDALVRAELGRHRGRELQTTGDGFLATFPGPVRGIRCACSISKSIRDLGVSIRSGLHLGEIELRGNDIGGLGVHIGARVMSAAGPDEVLVSKAVKDLVAGSEIAFVPKGSHQLKGLPGHWDLFSVNHDSALTGDPQARDRGPADQLSLLDRSLVAFTRGAPWATRALVRSAQNNS
jgi:class 3 adenylate cyclase